MKNIHEYKGYLTKIEYSSEDGVLFGKVEGINDLILFESESVYEIENKFHEAVDEYLDYCKENHIHPNKSYKGSFNIRIDPNLHKKLANIAYKNHESLNSLVEKALNRFVDCDEVVLVEDIWENQNLPRVSINDYQTDILGDFNNLAQGNSVYYNARINYGN